MATQLGVPEAEADLKPDLRRVHSDGNIGGRIELRFDELDHLERAIAVARGRP